MKTIYEKYAQLLVQYSLRLKAKEKLQIRGSYLAEPLIKEVYKEALKVGAYPEINVSINGISQNFFKYANDDQIKYVSPITELVTKKYDAFLNILSPFNLKATQNVDPDKKRMQSEANLEMHKTFMQRASKGDLKWTLCEFPTDAQAQESGMSKEEYEDFVFKACFLYENDPVQKWNEVHEMQEKIIKYLSQKNEIRYVGKDTDIRFKTKGRKWINSDGKNNMPSGEVFTTPIENSINGTIRFSYPGIFMGKEIEDIFLKVKDGEVVHYEAAKGEEFLTKLFEIPGSRRFGEAAIGTNYGVDTFTKNMLFDEKMGGTIHMALGAAYPSTGGKNESAIQWDLLCDLKNRGAIYADDEKFYENGKFLII